MGVPGSYFTATGSYAIIWSWSSEIIILVLFIAETIAIVDMFAFPGHSKRKKLKANRPK
jgi:hypothetical protein